VPAGHTGNEGRFISGSFNIAVRCLARVRAMSQDGQGIPESEDDIVTTSNCCLHDEDSITFRSEDCNTAGMGAADWGRASRGANWRCILEVAAAKMRPRPHLASCSTISHPLRRNHVSCLS